VSHPLQHPASTPLLQRVVDAFKTDKLFISRDRHIVFVCGGDPDGDFARPRFLAYANTQIREIRPFLAEAAQKDYLTSGTPIFSNIAIFEGLIAKIADCVVLFSESPGSFAELGYFAQAKGIKNKLLVVLDQQYQTPDSFLTIGPIDLINRASLFKPALYLSLSDDAEFQHIKNRIIERLPVRNRQKFQYKRYPDLPLQEKMYAISTIVDVFRIIDFPGIEHVFKAIFGNRKINELKRLLSILVAVDQLRRVGDDLEYFVTAPGARPFMEFVGLDISSLRLQVTAHYQSHAKPLIEILERAAA